MKFRFLLLVAPFFLIACTTPDLDNASVADEKTSGTPAKYDTFADCVTNSGAIFYGTEWCPHCKSQKTLFGDAFAKINYVDCDQESTLCQNAKITGYPTWIFADGTMRSGTQPLADIAEMTECALPTDDAKNL